MSSSIFHVREHVVPGQHIREYPASTANSQEDVLQIHINQYTPHHQAKPGDITIIGAHANAFPKELYEPLWDDLYVLSKKANFSIRGIWIADVANQGASGVTNEDKLGDDPSWHDSARDLLHMINHFRSEMPRPIVGIGHSFGGSILANLALIHPRLFSTLVLIDPIMSKDSTLQVDSFNVARPSTFRRDHWPSRQVATTLFKSSKFYQAWDPRVLEKWLEYGLRDLPTSLYPDPMINNYSAKPVTLTTTKHQEVFSFYRPVYSPRSTDENPKEREERLIDLDTSIPGVYHFYRPEMVHVYNNLPFLRPSVLFIFGGKSEVSPARRQKAIVGLTGTGLGGSGGAKAGRVKAEVFEDAGHLIAMEHVQRTADTIGSWFGTEMERWRENEKKQQALWDGKTIREKSTISDMWKEKIGGPPRKPELGVGTKL